MHEKQELTEDFYRCSEVYCVQKTGETYKRRNDRGGKEMAGYYTSNGYYGYINGGYRYFTSQSDYYNEYEEAGSSHNVEFEEYETMLVEQWD